MTDEKQTLPAKAEVKKVPALAKAATNEEALAARARAVSTKRPLTLGTVGLLVLLGGFGSWAVFGEIAGAIIATGQIAVESNRQVVQHPDGGVVSEVLVSEGALAQQGDVLIRLDDTLLKSNMAIMRGQLAEIAARIARLRAERDDAEAITYPDWLLQVATTNPEISELIDGQTRLFDTRAENLTREAEQLGRRKTQIGSQVTGLQAQQASVDQQRALIEEELKTAQDLLQKGLAQAPRVLALQREAASLDGRVGELAASVAELQGRQTEIDIEILGLGTQRREEAITALRDLEFRFAEMQEQLRATQEQLSRMELRAPVSGVVYNLAVFGERAVIRPADPVLFLVPQDRPLVIQAQVDPIHVDQAYPGQPVTLRFSAFDSRTTPEVFGTVRQVSADAFTDQSTGLTFYRAEITLNEGEAARLGDNVLLPGMPVETYLRTDDRSPIRYLLKPMLDYFNRAFRES